MKEEIKNRVLQSIANTLGMYVYHIDNSGLVNGKMGIMLFLYCYSRYVKEEYYEDFAGELLDGMLKVSCSLPPDFEDGLAGVGWGFDWLMKHDFVEGDINKVLKPIDEKLFASASYGISNLITGLMNYWAARIRNGMEVSVIRQRLPVLLEFIRRSSRNTLSLYQINAILHFIYSTKNYLTTEEETELVQSLSRLANEAFDRLAFDGTDLFILHRLLEQSDNRIVLSKDSEITFCLYASTPLPVSQRIRAAWQEWMYLGEVKCPIPEDKEIMGYVDNSLRSIQPDDFVLNQGLAGLGLWMLNQ